jgi:hypothetical protein
MKKMKKKRLAKKAEKIVRGFPWPPPPHMQRTVEVHLGPGCRPCLRASVVCLFLGVVGRVWLAGWGNGCSVSGRAFVELRYHCIEQRAATAAINLSR